MVSEHVKQLRANLTDAELRLWHEVRRSALGHKFRRQHALGPYVVDFICLAQKLIIELDGGQHAEPENAVKETERSVWLEQRGYKVIRVGNNDIIENMSGVLIRIHDELKARE